MEKAKNIKIILGISYILVISIFLWFFFKNFSIQDFTSYEFIKNNLDEFNEIKNKNILIISLLFLVFTIIWVLLLGFGTPIFLFGGFIYSQINAQVLQKIAVKKIRSLVWEALHFLF